MVYHTDEPNPKTWFNHGFLVGYPTQLDNEVEHHEDGEPEQCKRNSIDY